MALDPRSGRVFVAGSHIVRVLDARSGDAAGTIALPGEPAAVAVAVRTGRGLVTATVDGTYAGPIPTSPKHGVALLLDARTGKVLRAVHTGQDPTSVAIDEQRGRAFVTNINDASLSVIDLTP